MGRVCWRMLTQNPMRAFATFIALCYAAAVITACGVLLESALRYHGAPQQYAGAPIVVATTQLTTVEGGGEDLSVNTDPLPEGGLLDAGLADRIAAVPGVARVLADIAVPVQLAGRTAGGATAAWSGTGHPWPAAALTPFILRSGTAPASPGDVVLDASTARAAGVRTGEAIRLVLPTGIRTFRVAGIAAGDGALSGLTVFFPAAVAQSLSGHPGSFAVLGVIPRPGVSTQALAAAVRRVLPARTPAAEGAFPQVYTGADRGLAGSPAVPEGRVNVIATVSTFGGCAFLVAIFVISGTITLSVQQRHRDIALLRAVAATPRQVRRMILTEALLIALAAGALGVWAGFASASWLRSQFVAQGFAPASFAVRYSWLPPVTAVGAVLVVALVAAWIAGLRASRIRPVEALREASVERRGGAASVVRIVLGLSTLGGAIALTGLATHLTASAAAGTAIGMVGAFVLAVALLAPWLTRFAVALCGVGLRRLGVTGRLAAASLAASARRLSPVVAALVLAVALGGSLWFLQTSVQHAAVSQSRAGLLASQVIAPAGAGGLPADVVSAARRVPGVAAVSSVLRSTVFDSAADDYTAEGVDPAALPKVIDLGVVSGSLTALSTSPGAVAVDTVTAADLRLRAGSEFAGWFGDGTPVTLRVVAIYRRGLGFANFTLPIGVLRPHTAAGMDGDVLVADGPGASTREVAVSLTRALAGVDPAAAVLTPDRYQAAVSESVAQNTWSIHVSVLVLLAYVVIAALNTLAMAAFARRSELAVLRLSGLTRRQLLRMARIEQTVLLGLALVVGGLIAAATLVPMVNGTTGSPTPYIPVLGWVAVIGGVILLGIAGTLLPILSMLRTRPIEAIGFDE